MSFPLDLDFGGYDLEREISFDFRAWAQEQETARVQEHETMIHMSEAQEHETMSPWPWGGGGLLDESDDESEIFPLDLDFGGYDLEREISFDFRAWAQEQEIARVQEHETMIQMSEAQEHETMSPWPWGSSGLLDESDDESEIFPLDLDFGGYDLEREISFDFRAWAQEQETARVQEHETISPSPWGGIGGLLLDESNDESEISFEQQTMIPMSNGLSKEAISAYLKTRNGVTDKDKEDPKICTLCQDDLCQENEKIGMLDCGHEYHSCCIKQWLQHKNICPLCKRTALPMAVGR